VPSPTAPNELNLALAPLIVGQTEKNVDPFFPDKMGLNRQESISCYCPFNFNTFLPFSIFSIYAESNFFSQNITEK
jgi:hypothetical protein